MTDPTVKANVRLPTPQLRLAFQHILEGASAFIPRGSSPAELERHSLAHNPLDGLDIAKHQAAMYARLADANASFNLHVNALVEKLIQKEITPSVFRVHMLEEIRYSLLTGMTIGAGSLAALTQDDIHRVDTRLRTEAVYLDNWVAQLERLPDKEWSLGQLQNRARMYGGSGHAIAQETFDKNRMRAYPSLPLYPKGLEYPSLCRTRCLCGWIWENVDQSIGSADVYWRLNVTGVAKGSGKDGESEHCESCLIRAAAFNPLKCRNWSWVGLPNDLSLYSYK